MSFIEGEQHSNLVQLLFLRTLEKGIESPYALSEIKPYFEDLTLAVIKATAVEMVSEDNFPSKSRKVECATVSVIEI